MGALLRCASCGKEMVLEAYHAGRNVPCPWCRARNDVPQGIDFATVDRAQARDEARGGTLLALSVVALPTFCTPLAGWVWWSARGTIARAEDDGRPVDGLVRWAGRIAMVATVLHLCGWTLTLVSALS